MLLAAIVWTLLLLGLFAMHGASSHGATAHASAPSSSVLGVPVSHDGHAGHVDIADNGDPVQDSETGGGSGSPGHSSAELCLAILCALLTALAAFGALTYPKRPRFGVRRSGYRTPLPSWLQPPDPPCLIRLSILRC